MPPDLQTHLAQLLSDFTSVKEKDSAVKFLWNCKLKSRNSFLAILENINLPRSTLNQMLSLLAPHGPLFFTNYVLGSH